MFTGLIVELGEVVSVTERQGSGRLVLGAKAVADDAETGDSIAINGVCLTVVERGGPRLSFDLSGETLRTSNLGTLRPGERVNLEPSLKTNSKLGGHFVTGHIDGLGRIRSKTVSGDVYHIVIDTEERLADLLVEKGSVAVDGISLTVVDVFRAGFSVVVIPHTAKMTTIGFKNTGSVVNVEVDILGKYVSRFLGKTKDSRFRETLEREGFM